MFPAKQSLLWFLCREHPVPLLHARWTTAGGSEPMSTRAETQLRPKHAELPGRTLSGLSAELDCLY